MISFKAHKKRLYALAFSPDGRFLATAGADDAVRLHALNAGAKPTLTHEWKEVGDSLAFSPDSRMLVCAGRGVRVWDMADVSFGELFAETRRGSSGHVCFCGGERFFVHGDGGLRCWDITTPNKKGAKPAIKPAKCGWGGTRESKDNKQFPLQTVACTPDGKTLVASFAVQTIAYDSVHFLFDTKTGKEKGRLHATHYQGHPVSISLSPDGSLLASNYGSAIAIWSIKEKKEIKRWSSGTKHVQALAFTASGARLIAVNNSEAVFQWDTKTWKEVRHLEWKKVGKLTNLAVSADGCLIAAGTALGNVVVWDAD